MVDGVATEWVEFGGEEWSGEELVVRSGVERS